MHYHIDAEQDVLYKYTTKENAERMMKAGSFRFGTLYEYQLIEHDEVGDAYEGFQIFEFDLEKPARPQLELLIGTYPHLSGLRSNPEFAKDIPLGVPVQINVLAPDCYLFCTTNKFDADAMQRFGYDACLEIQQPKEFFFSLSRALVKHAAFASWKVCQYVDRACSITVPSPHTAQSLKPRCLAHQSEIRFAWDPLPSVDRLVDGRDTFRPWNVYAPANRLPEAALEPIIISIPEAVTHLRRFI